MPEDALDEPDVPEEPLDAAEPDEEEEGALLDDDEVAVVAVVEVWEFVEA